MTKPRKAHDCCDCRWCSWEWAEYTYLHPKEWGVTPCLVGHRPHLYKTYPYGMEYRKRCSDYQLDEKKVTYIKISGYN